MKIKLTFLLLFTVAFCNEQIVNIPDANFKAKLLQASLIKTKKLNLQSNKNSKIIFKNLILKMNN